MTGRQLPLSDYRKLKAATRELVDLVGSDAHAARISRVSPVQIGRYGSVNEDFEEVFAPIDIIADIEAEVGPVVTRELAALSGHVLVEVKPDARPIGDLAQAVGKAMKEFGDVVIGTSAALSDGSLDPAEGPPLIKDIDEALSMIATMRLMVLNATKGSSNDA